jgi:uncharacterized protein YkwD
VALVAALCCAVIAGCRPEGSVAKAPAAETPAAPPPPVEYSTTTTSRGVRGGDRAEELYDLVRERFSQLSLEPDGRLADLAAQILVKTQDQGNKMPDAVQLDALARQHGLVGPCPYVVIAPFALGQWRRIEDLLSGVPSNLRFTHIGVVSRDVGGGAIGAFALGSQHLSLSPVSSQATAKATLRFAGEIDAEYRELQWVWTVPDGSTRTIAVAKTREFSFVTEPLAAGLHRFEAFGVGPSGLEVLVNLPISVGSVVSTPEPEEEPVVGLEPAEALLGMLNRARARAGARPLLRAPVLDRLAESHSRDMAENRFFGHESPTTGDSVRRAFESGARFERFGENVGRGSTVAVVHRLLMESPGHRRNILNPDFTHVGVGIVVDSSFGNALDVTEVFGAFPVPLADPGAYATRLFQQLNVNRKVAGVPPVTRDLVLDRVSAAIAARLSAAKDVQRKDVNRVVTQDDLAAVGHEFLLLPMFPVGTEELSSLPVLLDAEIHAAGVGVVQSEPTADHPRANVVVFALSR